MIIFKKIKYKNFLSTGNNYNEIILNGDSHAIVIGKNGSGKCFSKNTPIKVRNKKTGQIVETTIGELYDLEKKKNDTRED